MVGRLELEQPPPPTDKIFGHLKGYEEGHHNALLRGEDKSNGIRGRLSNDGLIYCEPGELGISESDDESGLDYFLHTSSCRPLLVSSENDFKEEGAKPGPEAEVKSDSHKETKLLTTFLLMVVIGTANKIFQKLQTVPMYNYPNSLTLLQNFVYVPLCFAYIFPVSRFGLFNNAIPPEVTAMNKRPFVIMGMLDCITCTLFTFASIYLPGSLLVLLPQAAIPISMALSKKLKGETYKYNQYLGAAIVVCGILAVLEPLLTSRHAPSYVCEAFDEQEFCGLCGQETTEEGCLSHRINSRALGATVGEIHGLELWHVESSAVPRSLSLFSTDNESSASLDEDDHNGALCRWTPSQSASSSPSETSATLLIWSLVTIVACIPMTLSSIYKEMALDESVELDPIFLNGWVAWFQFLFSFPLAIPAGMTTSPPVPPRELPQNIWDGVKCYIGSGTIEHGCHPDDHCNEAPFYVNMFLAFNVCFNILLVYMLKYGSANVLFMASTIMVPIGNLAFAMPFMPGSTPLHDSDVLGLVVILLGLVMYRFGHEIKCNICEMCNLGYGLSNWRTIPPLPWRWRGPNRKFRALNSESFSWANHPFDDSSETSLIQTPFFSTEEPLMSHVERQID